VIGQSVTGCGLGPSSIRRKFAAVASLFDHLREVNAVSHNAVRGVKRPKAEGNEAQGAGVGRRLSTGGLGRAPAHTLKGKRDRPILATFLHHVQRIAEAASGLFELNRSLPFHATDGCPGFWSADFVTRTAAEYVGRKPLSKKALCPGPQGISACHCTKRRPTPVTQTRSKRSRTCAENDLPTGNHCWHGSIR
jgi:hypothetical protein